jgi:hypothetical protein
MHSAHKEGAVEFLAPREQKGGAYVRRRTDHNATVHLKLFADNLGHEQGVFDARCLRPPERVSVERWTRHGRAVGALFANRPSQRNFDTSRQARWFEGERGRGDFGEVIVALAALCGSHTSVARSTGGASPGNVAFIPSPSR